MNSTKELREFLVNQMMMTADGKIDLDRTKGVANIAQQIYNTLNIEVRMAKARSELGDDSIKSVTFG